MRLSLFATTIAILFCTQVVLAQDAPQTPNTPPQGVQLTQEHIQIMQQIVQQMPAAQREELSKLPKEQQQQVLLQLLARVLQPKQPPIRELLQEDKDKSVNFEDPDQYPDCAERIVDFVRKKVDRQIEVTAIAYLHEGHDHFFVYKRLYRVKYKTPNDGKEYMADFLFEKNGPYLKVKEWRRVPEDQQPKQG